MHACGVRPHVIAQDIIMCTEGTHIPIHLHSNPLIPRDHIHFYNIIARFDDTQSSITIEFLPLCVETNVIARDLIVLSF